MTVTGESCLDLLSHWLIPELDIVGLLSSVILQDGVPVHCAPEVRAFLNNQFPQWTGQHGHLIWPFRSPDLTTCHT
jgi:hypothetical protein